MSTSAHIDPLDHSAEIVDKQLSIAIAAYSMKPEQVPGPDGKWPTEDCVDCGEPIGEVRLKMGRVRCIRCQTALEKRRA